MTNKSEPPLGPSSGRCRGAIVRRTGARQLITALRDTTGFTASLAALDDTRGIYVYRAVGVDTVQREADMRLRAGDAIPLHCTAAGKALLGALKEKESRRLISRLTLVAYTKRTAKYKKTLTREVKSAAWRGVAVADSEFIGGITSIAASVVPCPSELVLAIELTIPHGHGIFGYARLVDRVSLELLETAEEMSRRLRPSQALAPSSSISIVPERRRLTPAAREARAAEMARLRTEEELSYRCIGLRYGLTRQRVEQIIKGYIQGKML